MSDKQSELSQLRNIGPTIEQRLHQIGIYTKHDLERVGAVEAYKRICEHNPGTTISVCYYLYSLQGALLDIYWDDLPEDMKEQLRQEAGW